MTGHDDPTNVNPESEFGKGTFVPYHNGQLTITNPGRSLTGGRLYRDGVSTTPNPRPIAWFPFGGSLSTAGTWVNQGIQGMSWMNTAANGRVAYQMNTMFYWHQTLSLVASAEGNLLRCVKE